MYVCGATVQGLPHIGHVRVRAELRRAAPLARPPGLRRHARAQRHRHRRQDPAPRPPSAGRPWWEWAATHERAFAAAYDALGCLPPSIEPRATGHVPQMIELMRAADRARARLRGGRRRLLRGAVRSRTTARCRASGSTTSRRARSRPRQARPARLHAVEGGQARRAVLADAVGPGRPGWHLECSAMATAYLGPGVRHPRRRARPGLPAPRERAGPVARRRRPVRPLLAAQRVGHHGRREDVEVAGQHGKWRSPCHRFSIHRIAGSGTIVVIQGPRSRPGPRAAGTAPPAGT